MTYNLSFKLDRGSALNGKVSFDYKDSVNNVFDGSTVLYKITDSGFEKVEPNIVVDPMKVIGGDYTKSITVSGKTLPNYKVSISGNGVNVSTVSDGNGYYKANLVTENYFSTATPIDISTDFYSERIYPQLKDEKNMKMKTFSGYEYTLNSDLENLKKPFDIELVYMYTQLSDEGKKAFVHAYNELLGNFQINKPYAKKKGDVVGEYDISYEGIAENLTKEDLSNISRVIVRGLPRMYMIKDWPGSPIYDKSGKTIIGQKFFIGNGIKNVDDYYSTLQATEPDVSNILGSVTPDMDVYQIIRAVKTKYESSMNYAFGGSDEDIRDAFINHKAVCGGYSKGLEYLLMRLGIENAWVGGFAFVDKGPHAWNMVPLYNKWYLSDSTWGGEHWYLDGQNWKSVESRRLWPSDGHMPNLAQVGIPWEAGSLTDTLSNNMGQVSYKYNDNGTITINYSDKEGLNESVSINPSYNNYSPIQMTRKNGVWTATITPPSTSGDKFNFYFYVNNFYGTVGNISGTDLQTIDIRDGYHNIEMKIEAHKKGSDKNHSSTAGGSKHYSSSSSSSQVQGQSSQQETQNSEGKDGDVSILNNIGIDGKYTRIGGKNRYMTSVDISKKFFKSADNVVIASGEKYADALSSSSFAKSVNSPILLTKKDVVPEDIMKEIKRLGAKKITIVGGESTVSESVIKNLKEKGLEVERISGENRFKTSYELSKQVIKKFNSDKVIIVNGFKDSDALTVASYANRFNLPILMTDGKTLPEDIKALINEKKMDVVLIGGESSVSESITSGLNGVKVERIAGENRFETAQKIAEKSYPNSKDAIIANGYNAVDALSAGAVTYKAEAPIVLVDKNKVPKDMVKTIKAKEEIYVLGGNKTIE